MTHTEEWTKLEQLAMAATPGPWVVNKRGRSNVMDAAENQNCVAACGGPNRLADKHEANAALIAASNPQVILQLIALARSEAVLRTMIGSIFDTTILAGPGREEKLQSISRQARHALAESERLREVMK
jgi:hypothetical protein